MGPRESSVHAMYPAKLLTIIISFNALQPSQKAGLNNDRFTDEETETLRS
jgi:hypothetical protein